MILNSAALTADLEVLNSASARLTACPAALPEPRPKTSPTAASRISPASRQDRPTPRRRSPSIRLARNLHRNHHPVRVERRVGRRDRTARGREADGHWSSGAARSAIAATGPCRLLVPRSASPHLRRPRLRLPNCRRVRPGQSHKRGNLQVQARLAWPGAASNYSVITEIAIQVGADVVTINSPRADAVWVDGQAVTFTGATFSLTDGLITKTAQGYVVALNSGETVTADITSGGVTTAVALAQHAAHGSVEGLLGDYNGAADDLTLADGTVKPLNMSTSTLYGAFANSWRVTQATSLLDYGQGQTTATFTDANSSGSPISVGSFAPAAVAAATAIVQQAASRIRACCRSGL